MAKINILYHRSAKILAYNLAEANEIVIPIGEAITGNQTCNALGIKDCIAHKMPSWKIIRELKDIIADNRAAMCGMLGNSLVLKIENF